MSHGGRGHRSVKISFRPKPLEISTLGKDGVVAYKTHTIDRARKGSGLGRSEHQVSIYQ
jgi:hypothetical protein